MLECGFLFPTTFVHASLKINSKNVNARVHCEELCLLLHEQTYVFECARVSAHIQLPSSPVLICALCDHFSWQPFMKRPFGGCWAFPSVHVCICIYPIYPLTYEHQTKYNSTRLIKKYFCAIKITKQIVSLQRICHKKQM